MEIGRGNKRRVQKRRQRRNAFNEKRRRIFLEELAVSCNATTAARKAGVAYSTPYMARMRDAAFREQWSQALDQGTARLEAELVALAIRSLRPRRRRSGAEAPPPIDPAMALQIVKLHQARTEGRIGRPPAVADIEATRRRLEKKMRALGIVAEGVAGHGSAAGVGGEAEGAPPPCCARSPSPANAGEDVG